MFYIFSDSDSKKLENLALPLMSSPVKTLTPDTFKNLGAECVVLEIDGSGTILLDICEKLISDEFTGQLYVISSAMDERLDTLMSQVLTSYGIDAVVLNGRVDLKQALEWIDEHNIDAYSGKENHSPASKLEDDVIEELIRDEQLTVHYQGQFQSHSLELIGLEALARLYYNNTPVPLGDVFNVILERDLWTDLTRSVLNTSLHQHAEIFKKFPKVNLAINLSAKELSKHSFSSYLKKSLSDSSITAGRLMFELTENELYSSHSTVARHLFLLKGCGARLSIDDYGTGLSNAARLTTAPFDELKLDKSFIKNIQYISEKSVAKSTAEIARTLNMKTVAEGVEDKSILNDVRELGIDQVQGFLLHKPESFEDIMNNDLRPTV